LACWVFSKSIDTLARLALPALFLFSVCDGQLSGKVSFASKIYLKKGISLSARLSVPVYVSVPGLALAFFISFF